MTSMVAGHGPNVGHGFVKYIIITQDGTELAPVVFPAMTAPAGHQVAGAIAAAQSIEAAGRR